jgi:hypothetical protein
MISDTILDKYATILVGTGWCQPWVTPSAALSQCLPETLPTLPSSLAFSLFQLFQQEASAFLPPSHICD